MEVQEKCGQTLSMEHFASFVSIAVRILSDLKGGKIWDTDSVCVCVGGGQSEAQYGTLCLFLSIAVRILSDLKGGKIWDEDV